jgi:hypothetical protein
LRNITLTPELGGANPRVRGFRARGTTHISHLMLFDALADIPEALLKSKTLVGALDIKLTQQLSSTADLQVLGPTMDQRVAMLANTTGYSKSGTLPYVFVRSYNSGLWCLQDKTRELASKLVDLPNPLWRCQHTAWRKVRCGGTYSESDCRSQYIAGGPPA